MHIRDSNVDSEGVSMCHWTVGLIKINTFKISLSDPLVPTTPPGTRFMALLHEILTFSWTQYVYVYSHAHSPADVMITSSAAPLRQEPAHRCIRYPTLAPSSASAVPSWQPFLTRFDSQFPILLDSIVLLFDYTQFFYFFF